MGKVTPYYDEDGITIYHGDCREVLPTLSGVALVVTSPPYNLGAVPWPPFGHWQPGDKTSGGGGAWTAGPTSANGVDYGQHDDAMPWHEYVEWQRDCLYLMWMTLRDDGAIFYNHKPRVVGPRVWLPTAIARPDTQGQHLRQIVTWVRRGGFNHTPSAFTPSYEWILIYAREGWRLSGSAPDVWDIWPAPNPHHPAPFPLAVPEFAISHATRLGNLVVDPFMGSGTTLLAAKNLSRRAIGIEIEEKYCEIAAQRLAQGVLEFS